MGLRLLESGDHLLLESGDNRDLEDTGVVVPPPDPGPSLPAAGYRLLESGDYVLLESTGGRALEGTPPPPTPVPVPTEGDIELFVPRTWVDYEDDLDAEAMNDLEARISTGLSPIGTTFDPADFGAFADGDSLTPHDDTVALQACIDAAMASDANPGIIKLQPGATYLVNGAPRTDRGGNCILSVVQGAFGTKSILFDGGDGPAVNNADVKTRIQTTRTTDELLPGPNVNLTADLNFGDTVAHVLNTTGWPSSGGFYCQRTAYIYTSKTSNTLTGVERVTGPEASHADTNSIYFTYGPPSVIGGETEEQGWGPNEITGPIGFRNVAIIVPTDPAICGIDGISWGGFDLDKGVQVIGKPVSTTRPVNTWAFGIRYPGSFGFGYYRSAAGVQGMYAGHVLRTTDHVRLDAAHADNCTLGLGLQDGAGIAQIGLQHAVGGGYCSLEHCGHYIAGWSATAGACSMTPSTAGHEVAFFGDLVVDIETGSGVFVGDETILDADSMIGGHIHVHRFTGLGIGSSVGSVDGGQNLIVKNLRHAIPVVVSDSTLDLSGARGNGIVHITDNNPINFISILPLGEPMTLWLTGTATINHDHASVPDGYAAILLNGSAAFTGAAQRVLTVVYNGVNFIEVSRRDN